MSKLDDMVEPETASVHRLEVISGSGRRRSFSDEFKVRVVEETLAPGAVVSRIARRHALSRWAGLIRFIDDGRIEIDSNVVERSIRSIALNRKNALFAGSDGGGEHWAIIASLIETCKLNGIDPQAYLTDVITRIASGHPNSRLDELLPWCYAETRALKAVA